MATEAQINANRANAQKSTGPTSEAGREKSSRNSTTHGRFARSVVLESECGDLFTYLFQSLLKEFQPATEFERCLVQNMAAARWRQYRMWNIDHVLLTEEMTRQSGYTAAEKVKPASLAASAFSAKGADFDLLRRFENSYDRQFLRSYNQLIKAKRNRQHDDS